MKSSVAMTGGTAGLEKKRKKGSGLQRRNSLIAMTFIAPNFIGFFVLTLVPFCFHLRSLSWNGIPQIQWFLLAWKLPVALFR